MIDKNKSRLHLIIFSVVFIVGIILYALKEFQSSYVSISIWSGLSSILCFVLFMLLVYRFIAVIIEYFSERNELITLNSDTSEGLNSSKPDKFKAPTIPLTLERSVPKWRAWLNICILILVIKIGTYAISYIFGVYSGNISGSFFESFYYLWCETGIDAPSYLGIAENWYVTSGDAMYHIVFFPFYSIVIKALYFIVGDYLLSATLISTICSFVIGIVGYELVRLDYSEKHAFRFVKYVFILPAAFFYCAPMTEALFVMLCLLCFYFTRKRNFALAALFGALAAFTRSPGILLMVPMGIEYIRILIETKRDEQQKDKFLKRLFGLGALVLSVSLGFIAYLGINYYVWGNPLQFSIFQSEHWNQGMGYFFYTADYQVYYMLRYLDQYLADPTNLYNIKTAISLFGFNLLFIHGALLIVALAAKKLHVSYTGYFIAYYVLTIGATWLLSAPRYLMASVTLPLAIATMTDKRISDVFWTIGCSVVSIVFLIMFACGFPIY